MINHKCSFAEHRFCSPRIFRPGLSLQILTIVDRVMPCFSFYIKAQNFNHKLGITKEGIYLFVKLLIDDGLIKKLFNINYVVQ